MMSSSDLARPALSRKNRSPGQRKLKCQRLEREESKLLMQRNMDSLKRIIAEERNKDISLLRPLTKGCESLASMGVSFSLLGIDDDISDYFTVESVPPTPASIWENSESSSSHSTFAVEEEDDRLRQTATTTTTTTTTTTATPTGEDMVEVSPGYNLPLRRSGETWNAILDGRTIRTPCFLCEQELTCVEDAELLACSDCWVFSPIERFDRRRSGYGVCIGVKHSDIQSWLGRASSM
jgi:hypothetical protein